MIKPLARWAIGPAALLLALPAAAQDRVTPGRAPAAVVSAMAVVCVDPATGVPNDCQGSGGGSVSATATTASPSYSSGSSGSLSLNLHGAQRVVLQNPDGTDYDTTTPFTCAVVSGDQSYTAGVNNNCTLTTTGRLKVGLSSAAASAAPATAATDDLLTGGKYTAAGVTLTDGQQAPLQMDSAGNLKISGGFPSGAQVTKGAQLGVVNYLYDTSGNPIDYTGADQVYSSDAYLNITTKTSTQVKTGAGTLARIVINKAGSADTLALYDNSACSGTLIGTITVAASVNNSITYSAAFGAGLCIISGGTTAGDYTVVYR